MKNYLFTLSNNDLEKLKSENDDFIKTMFQIIDLYKKIKLKEEVVENTGIVELFAKAKSYFDESVAGKKTQHLMFDWEVFARKTESEVEYLRIKNEYESTPSDRFKIKQQEIKSKDGKMIERINILTDYRGGDDKIIKIPNGINKIERLCFYNISNIRIIWIPNTVTNISEKAFHCCKNLEKIYVSKEFNKNILYGCDKAKLIVIK